MAIEATTMEPLLHTEQGPTAIVTKLHVSTVGIIQALFFQEAVDIPTYLLNFITVDCVGFVCFLCVFMQLQR